MERLITWHRQDHCGCCAYLIRVLTAGQKKEDLENVPKNTPLCKQMLLPLEENSHLPRMVIAANYKNSVDGPSTSEKCTLIVFNTAITCQIW